MTSPELIQFFEQQEGVDLDKLQREAEGLLSLLKDRQPGIDMWEENMQQHLEALHRLTLKALGREVLSQDEEISVAIHLAVARFRKTLPPIEAPKTLKDIKGHKLFFDDDE
jgi:hypothetical protein